MGDIARHLAWFFIVASTVAYLIFLALGSVIQAQALDASHVVTVRDALKPGEHNLSGIVLVPKTCSQLSVSSEQLSPDLYALHFTTWDEPSVNCEVDDTARAFHAIIFAPTAGISFVGSLDDTPLQLAVIPVPPMQ